MSNSRSVVVKDKVVAILSFSEVPRTNPAVLLPDSGTQPKVFARLPTSWFNTDSIPDLCEVFSILLL